MAGPWEKFGATADDESGPWAKFSNLDPGAQAKASPAAAPGMTWGETGADVAKSAGIGLVQGGIGLATLPGNVEQLGRMGINKVASLAGYGDQVVADDASAPLWPTYGEAKAAIEGVTGEFYKPKSTAGEYARTVGEFAPMAAFGPAGAAARTANVLGPAIGSETAGQLTKGTEYETAARLAGGVMGGALPSVGMRTVTPNPATGERAAALANLRSHGVNDLTAGQITGKMPLRVAESVAEHTPFGGNIPARMATNQNEQFTQAALRTAGVNARRATSDVIDAAYANAGQTFDDLAARSTLVVDPRLHADLNNARTAYVRLVEGQAAPIVNEIVERMTRLVPGANLAGDQYQAIRGIVDRSQRSTRLSNPPLSEALGNIRNALDDAVERGSAPGLRQEWQVARDQYRNLLAIEKASIGAGENAALGILSPAALKNAVKTQNPRAYARGQRELGELARSGEAILKPLPNSGTAPRTQVVQTARDLGAAAGAAIAGSAAGPGMLAGLGAVALPAIASRAVMSPLAQRWLTNQRLTPMLDAYNAQRPGVAARAAISAGPSVGGLEGRQTEGAYSDEEKEENRKRANRSAGGGVGDLPNIKFTSSRR